VLKHPGRTAVTIAVLVAGLAVAAFAAHRELAGPDASAPSCSRPAHIQHANAVQDGLIRCYLQAVADQSSSEMRAVVPARGNGGPTDLGPEAFAHAADARSGEATATVTGNDVDDADATVAIRYADGASDELDIHIANPASARSWRFSNVGLFPSGPPPAQVSPNGRPT
jgi:hypothetical protein